MCEGVVSPNELFTPTNKTQGWDDPGLQEEAGAEAGLEAEAGFDPEEISEFERQEGHPEGRAADVDGGEVYKSACSARLQHLRP